MSYLPRLSQDKLFPTISSRVREAEMNVEATHMYSVCPQLYRVSSSICALFRLPSRLFSAESPQDRLVPYRLLIYLHFAVCVPSILRLMYDETLFIFFFTQQSASLSRACIPPPQDRLASYKFLTPFCTRYSNITERRSHIPFFFVCSSSCLSRPSTHSPRDRRASCKVNFLASLFLRQTITCLKTLI